MSVRNEVLDALRGFVNHDFAAWPEGGNHPLIGDIVGRTADPIEAYSVVWQLVAEGVIVPGTGIGLRDGRGNDALKTFPYFSITARGREVLGAARPS